MGVVMLLGKNMFGSVVRTPVSRFDRVRADATLSNFAFEYMAAVQDEDSTFAGKTCFYVAKIVAGNMQEAQMLLQTHLRQRHISLQAVVRRFDLGKDRSWLRGKSHARTKAAVYDIRMYDKRIYDNLDQEVQIELRRL